jgi:hypothetical protein
MSNPFRPTGGFILPPPPKPRGPADFGAPVGGRVRFTTRLVFAIVGLMAVVQVVIAWLARMPRHDAWVLALAPVIAAAIIVPVAMLSQVRGYRVTPEALIVLRRNRENRFPLAGLRSVEADPLAMQWSFKLWGNDGLGAVTGKFRNKKLGTYEALVTDRGRAVVLRWPDRCLVVSPDRPEEFVAAVRTRAGLTR